MGVAPSHPQSGYRVAGTCLFHSARLDVDQRITRNTTFTQPGAYLLSSLWPTPRSHWQTPTPQ